MSRSKPQQRSQQRNESRSVRAELRLADYESAAAAGRALGLEDSLAIMDLVTDISGRDSGVDQMSALQARKGSLLASLNPPPGKEAVAFAKIAVVCS